MSFSTIQKPIESRERGEPIAKVVIVRGVHHKRGILARTDSPQISTSSPSRLDTAVVALYFLRVCIALNLEPSSAPRYGAVGSLSSRTIYYRLGVHSSFCNFAFLQNNKIIYLILLYIYILNYYCLFV